MAYLFLFIKFIIFLKKDLFLFTFLMFSLFYAYGFFDCLDVCTSMSAPWCAGCSQRSEESIGSSETGHTDGYELPRGC